MAIPPASVALPTLGFGGAPLGNLYAPMHDADATAAVGHALARGIRYFDTAPHYGNGLSEHRLGHALRAAAQDNCVVSTKVGRLLVPDPRAPRNQHGYVDVLPFVQRWDYSFDATLRSVEDSLQRLGAARFDIAYIHDLARDAHGDAFPDRFREAMNGAVPALARLKAEGTIGGYGIGVNEWQACIEALAHADVDVLLLAGRYTLADQSAARELLPRCVARGVRVVAGGPFNSGILATGASPADGSLPCFDYAPASASVVARVAAVEAVSAAHGVPLKAAALQFPLGHPAVACVLAGMRTPAEVDENLRLAAFPIPADYWRALKAHRLLDEDATVPSGDSA
jgi:D-threo-aldose 1-dehydrogenase